MDLDTLFWIAIVFVYFIFQVLGRKRAPEGPPAKPHQRREPENEELGEALKEIRRALGWPEEEEPAPEPRPVETASLPKLPPRIRPVPERPLIREKTVVRDVEDVKAHVQKPSRLSKQKPKTKISPLDARLRDPKTLRQEFLIREILDRPLVLRRDR